MLYSLALLLALLLSSPWWLLRMATAGKYRAGLAERLGFVPSALRRIAHGRRVVWIHAVSVGELIAVSGLLAELERARPDLLLCISTTTRTGHTLARQRYGDERVFYFPLDFAFILRRYLRALAPQMLILVETEFWPNLLLQCASRRLPIAVVNARISDRSFPRYRRLRALWRPLLAHVSLFCAQSPQDAARLSEIGASPDRIRSLGNLKFDVRAPQQTAFLANLRRHLPPSAPILVCGSTLDGEESALLDCLPALTTALPQLVCILAPRHPERFAAVAQLLTQRGIPFVRRSQWLPAQPIAPASVFLLDSVGELAAVYSLARVAFVGGTLVPTGGHNPLEPAQFAVPIVMGESYENFRSIVSSMLAANAIALVSRATLCSTLLQLLTDDAAATALGSAAQRVYQAESGATARTLAALLPLLPPASATAQGDA
jgi:3-deoxy-D-manno-octulosonic-acid transferase